MFEKVSDLRDKIAIAKMSGEESVEAEDDVIQYFNKRGLNGAKYFIMDNIKVYPVGKTDEIEEHENMRLDDRLHPKASTTTGA